MLDAKLLKTIEKLKFSPNLAIKNIHTGKRKSNQYGDSIEFSDYKKYIHGDDYRQIDWNLYARFEKLYVKQFHDERQVEINIFYDNSSSVEFYNKKKDISINLVEVLSFIGIKNMDKVNMYTQNRIRIEKNLAIQNLHEYGKITKKINSIKYYPNSIFDKIFKKNFNKGISIIISDCFDKKIFEVIKYLAFKKQEVIVFQTLDTKEINPDLKGDLLLTDIESKAGEKVSISKKEIRIYKKKLEAFIEKLETTTKKYRGTFLLIDSSRNIEEIVFKDLIKKNILR